MRILQFVDNTKQNSALRFSLSINKIFNERNGIECEVEYITSNNMLEFIKKIKFDEDFLRKINSYDYIFVHSLPINEELYNIINKNIYSKLILFITSFNIKEMVDQTSLRTFPVFLRRCNRIFIHQNSIGIYDYIHYNIGISINTKLRYFKYICDSFIYDKDISYKKNNMVIISSKGLGTNFQLYLDLFKRSNANSEYSNIVDWYGYGISKNIQMLSIDDFFENCNEDTTIIKHDKINIKGIIPMDECQAVMKNSSFVCFFDNTLHINYTLLDIIQNGTIPIIPIDIAKQIKINNKQTLADIKCGILLDPKNIDTTFVQIKNLINNKNSYIRLRNSIYNNIRHLYNTDVIINNILNDLEN